MHWVHLMGLTHIDSVISKGTIEASSSVGQVEGLSLGTEGGRLPGVELCVCVWKMARIEINLWSRFHKHVLVPCGAF